MSFEGASCALGHSVSSLVENVKQLTVQLDYELDICFYDNRRNSRALTG